MGIILAILFAILLDILFLYLSTHHRRAENTTEATHSKQEVIKVGDPVIIPDEVFDEVAGESETLPFLGLTYFVTDIKADIATLMYTNGRDAKLSVPIQFLQKDNLFPI